MPNGIVSIGYEGRSLDEFVDLLRSHGVVALYDVRLTPLSRKPGFSKRKLADAVERAGLVYVHARELGNPRENRDGFRNGAGTQARRRYRRLLGNGASDTFADLIADARTRVVAVMCVERDADCCHRGELIAAAKERSPRLRVTHVA